MMRLGQVMIKIDGNAAQKRYTTFVKRKTRVQKTISAFKRPKHQQQQQHNKMLKQKSLSNPESKFKSISCILCRHMVVMIVGVEVVLMGVVVVTVDMVVVNVMADVIMVLVVL